jgi:lysozyme
MKWFGPSLILLAAAGVVLFWPRRQVNVQAPAPVLDGFEPVAPWEPYLIPSPEPVASIAETYEPPNIIDTAMATVSSIVNPTPAADMRASDELRRILKASEALRLQPYALGDGGYTVGYGHFEKRREDLPVLNSIADAEALFDRDLEERAERWVRAYVHVPLLQNQYDALVHIAYNMSPRSFKKFADEVNAGRGIADIAEQSVAWVPARLQRGIANRREREVDLFETGVYA